MKRHLILPIISCAILSVSCIGTHYTNTDAPATLQYLHENTDKSLSNLSKSYHSTLNKTMKEGTPKPGLCAEYGVLLAKENKHEEANKWFNREVTIYPSASAYVYFLKKSLIPEFANDTAIYHHLDTTTTTLPVQNTVSIDSLTTAPQPEMSIIEKKKAAWERRKQEKALVKEEKQANKAQVKENKKAQQSEKIAKTKAKSKKDEPKAKKEKSKKK